MAKSRHDYVVAEMRQMDFCFRREPQTLVQQDTLLGSPWGSTQPKKKMIPSPEIRELTIRDYWEMVLKRKRLVIFFVLIIVTFVAFYDFSVSPRYETTVSIYIEKEIPKIISQENYVYQSVTRDKEYYQSQVNLLKSYSLANRVIDKLGLVGDKEFSEAKNPAVKLLSWIKVKPLRMSNIVDIVVSGQDRLKITSIANAWAREFIHQDIERRAGVAKYGVVWLEGQLSETLQKMQEAEKELNDFIKNNKIINIPDIEKEYDQSLLKDLEKQKTDLEKELVELSNKYKEKHPKVSALAEKLKMINYKIENETDDFLRLQELVAKYKILKRKVDTSKSIYDSLLQRAKELDVSKELAVSNIRIVDQAEVPLGSVWPNPKKDIPLTVVMSLFLAVGTCIFLEYLDSTLKTSEDVEFYTNMPFLGYIPAVKKEATPVNQNLFSHDKPHSLVAEAFKNLRISLTFSFPEDKSLKTIVITSSIPQEGKSFISSNLAISFAQTGEPTLLIDSDMRKGKLVKSYGLNTDIGLSSLLIGGASLNEAIVSTSVPNLSFIGSGPYTPNPTELLGSARLKEILDELRTKFKMIIIDSTPVLSVSEAILLGDKCNGLIFVIRAGYTSLKHINEAKKLLDKRSKIIGAVLNNTDADRGRYYSYHYYYTSENKE